MYIDQYKGEGLKLLVVITRELEMEHAKTMKFGNERAGEVLELVRRRTWSEIW